MRTLPLFNASHAAAALLLPLALLASGLASAADYKGCAVIDLTTIVRTSKVSQAAQQRLVEEFATQDAEKKARQQKLSDLDAELTSANQSGDASRQQAAANALMEAQARAAKLQAEFERNASRRKLEELHKIVQQASTLYQDIGARQGYAKLFQKGTAAPVFITSPDAERYVCVDKTDISEDVVKALDESNGQR